MSRTVAVPDDFTEDDAECFREELANTGSATTPKTPFRSVEYIHTHASDPDEIRVSLEEIPEIDLSPNENFQRGKRIKKIFDVNKAKWKYYGALENALGPKAARVAIGADLAWFGPDDGDDSGQ